MVGDGEDMGAGHVSNTMRTRIQAGHLWRKQVLPLGTVTLPRGELALTPEYLGWLAEAFDEAAFDYVPFQLAFDSEHTSDPDRWRGDVTGFEMADDGLDALIMATDEGNRAILETPGLDAAPRIINDYRTADGRVFPAAIQHILGTTKPLITGLRGWERVT